MSNRFLRTLCGIGLAGALVVFFGSGLSAQGADERLATGSVFEIANDEVGLKVPFDVKPKVQAIYDHPVTGKEGMKAAVKILTPVNVRTTAAVVECEWTKRIPLYEKKLLAAANKAATFTATWLADNSGQNQPLPLALHLGSKQVDPAQPVRTVQLSPPLIHDVEVGAEFITVTGQWFGTKKPKVWFERLDAKNRVKRLGCKVEKPDGEDGRVNAKLKPVYMNPADGSSKVVVRLPKLPDGVAWGDLSHVVMDNGFGLATATEIYTVTFDLDGKGTRTGGGDLVQSVSHGAAATAPEVTADAGWDFSGWDAAFDNVTSDLAVTALYSPDLDSQCATLVVQPKPDASVPAGSYQVSATLAPPPGQVPAGLWVTTEDGSAQSVILTTHSDGSAALMIVTALVTTTELDQRLEIPLYRTAAAPDEPLTAAAIAAINPSAVVDLKDYGVATLADLGDPEFISWATSRSICARYRVPGPLPGTTSLEVVFDIHVWPAWGTAPARGLVEVRVENSLITVVPHGSGSIAKPDAAMYTDATVTIGGMLAATVSSSGNTGEGTHTFSRAWYASGWTGAGDPGLHAAQLHTELQMNPLLFQVVRPADPATPAGWASSVYAPWSAVNQRERDMGAPGGHGSIGPLPMWDATYLQSGDPTLARAVEANALAILGFNVSVRDSGTGLPPTPAQMAGWNIYTGWPGQGNGDSIMTFELAHSPAAGLVAFLARPSPVFLEVAQNIANWCATAVDATGIGGQNLQLWGGTGLEDDTGVFGYWCQNRGRAWGVRSVAHAAFLSVGTEHRDGYRTWLDRNRIYLDDWTTQPYHAARLWGNGGSRSYLLNPDGENGPDYSGEPGMQLSTWQQNYMCMVLAMVANAKLLTGAQQTAFEELTDWALEWPVRWVNEQQATGAWRYMPYVLTTGNDPDNLLTTPTVWANVSYSAATWQARRDLHPMSDAPDARAGVLRVAEGEPYSYAAYGTSSGVSDTFYSSYWWAALCAAVERGVPGSAAAWATVNADCTNLTSWLDTAGAAGANPQWAWYPRANAATSPPLPKR
jgi:hypothetical protein